MTNRFFYDSNPNPEEEKHLADALAYGMGMGIVNPMGAFHYIALQKFYRPTPAKTIDLDSSQYSRDTPDPKA